MGFVHHQEPIIAEVVNEGKGAGAGLAIFDNGGIVFDAGTHACFADHFHVVAGAAGKAGGFQDLAFLVQFSQAFRQLQLHALQNSCTAFFFRNEVFGGGDGHFVQFLDDFAGNDVETAKAIHFVAEQLDAHTVFVVAGVDFNHVPMAAEGAAFQAKVVAGVLDSHQLVK